MKTRHRLQKQVLQLRNETKTPYLNSYANAASKTTDGHQKEGPQLRPCPRPAAQIAPDCLQKPLLQLRHKTRNPYLNSYANAAIETKISYESSISSYDFGRIASCRRPQARPQTALTQLRQETKNPYLNSYERETTETGKKEPALHRLPLTQPLPTITDALTLSPKLPAPTPCAEPAL